MADKERRKFLRQRYGALYHRATDFDRHVCAYCNTSRDVFDHVPALSLLDGIDVTEYLKKGGKFLLYPSCKECNSILHNKPYISFYDRLDYLSERYIKKLDKMETWSEHELSQMGPTMQAYIRAAQVKVQITIRKLEVIEEKRLNNEYEGLS